MQILITFHEYKTHKGTMELVSKAFTAIYKDNDRVEIPYTGFPRMLPSSPTQLMKYLHNVLYWEPVSKEIHKEGIFETGSYEAQVDLSLAI